MRKVENKQVKKSRRKSNPLARFTLIVILIVAAGVFIFYCIDNPGFLKEKFSSFFGDNENGEAALDLSEVSEGQTVDNIEESVAVSDSSKNEIKNTDEKKKVVAFDEDSASKEIESNPSLWQRIKNFLKNLGGDGGEIEGYPDKLEINFYFSGLGEEKKLVSEKRSINAGSPGNAVQNAVQELLKGPSKSYHFPVIPAGTKLLGVETYENTATIDLSQEFLENSLDTRILDEYVIYSIVNTLTEIPEIEGIIFYIEGVRIKVYGNIDLSVPAIRNAEYISEEEE